MKIEKPANIKDVAFNAGVSVSTVSRFLNKSGYVSLKAADRITKVISKLNYVPSRHARALISSRTKEIAVLVPDITNPLFAKAYITAQEYAEQYGYTVLLYNTSNSAKGEIKGLSICRNMQVEGVIFLFDSGDPLVAEHLKKMSIPIVLSYPQEKLLFDTVHAKRGHGLYLAAKHLCELGHKRIAYSGGPSESIVNQNRKMGFTQALTEFGLTIPREYIFEMDFSMDAGYKSGLFFNSLRNPPTAIAAANDIIAMGIMMAMTELGKRIPDDYSLIGMDNIEFTKICRPPLTTVDNDPVLLTSKACEYLFSRLIDGYDGEARIHVCPRKLVIRESTAPPC